ncbi:MAG: RsmB/NOP family class I SAM-dependent RNA methyltransferase [Kiritimatiellota bacterium]|nr:RsmB/NOP family class I SAM-dependent RNA methyltransferase [Kiritimatiellota bacterium]
MKTTELPPPPAGCRLKAMTLPPKAACKQAELAEPLIRQLEEAVNQGHPADQTLRRYYREHSEFGSRDRRFFSALVFSWFRWRGWLAPPEPARCAMAYLLDAMEPHPAVTLMTEQGGLCRLNLQPAGGMTVEEKAKHAGNWLGMPPPAIEQLVPAWLPAQLCVPNDTEPGTHRLQCIKAFQIRPSTWIRTERDAQERMSAALARHAIPAAAHPQIAGAIRLQGAPDLELLSTEVPFEIQDLASQCVGWICAPARGEHWWDVCAGAGGKSLHLADLMEQQGAILATDVRSGSLDALHKRAQGRRRNMIACRAWDGTRDPAPGQCFDGVLIDAPCSGIGTWARNSDARWRTTERDIAQRRIVQEQLLLAGADKVRPGGRLIYAVCTLTKAETQAVITGFLGARPDFQLEPTPHPLTGRSVPGQVWIWPWEADSNGMFIARMKRAANPSPRPHR